MVEEHCVQVGVKSYNAWALGRQIAAGRKSRSSLVRWAMGRITTGRSTLRWLSQLWSHSHCYRGTWGVDKFRHATKD